MIKRALKNNHIKNKYIKLELIQIVPPGSTIFLLYKIRTEKRKKNRFRKADNVTIL